MKKRIVLMALASFLIAACVVPLAVAGPDPYSLKQETYLLQKTDMGADPWTIIMPDSVAQNIAFGKLEYLNYPVEGAFCFDFKGYDFGAEATPLPTGAEYALIYYVDPGVGWPNGFPEVYVLGLSSGPFSPKPTKGNPKGNGNAKGLDGVDFKFCGCCADLTQIPVAEDVSYPNGGKIWLVPVQYLNGGEPVETCSWTTMTGWPAGGAGILFETSLITYGFVPAP